MTGAWLVATCGGLGYLRPAPGTWASLAALPLAWALYALGGFWLFSVACLAAVGLGTWAIAEALRDRADGVGTDPSEIVVDEIAGQWIALLPVALGAWIAGAPFLALWPGIVAAFVVFRAFDILKPGPVGWADGLGTAWGVMLDDVIAGWLAALVVAVLAALFHLVLL